MISRYEAYLNGEALSLIDPSIVVLDIQHTPISIKNQSFALAKRHGAHIYKRYVDKASVTVTFEIHEYNTKERQAICAEVARWAKNGGVLETSDREGLRMRCICETFPSVVSVRNWTDPIQIVFSGVALPFWEDKEPTTVILSGTSGSGSSFVPGVVDGAFVEVSMIANAPITTASFSVNGKSLNLSGLSMVANQELKIAYDEDMTQFIKVGNSSMLSKRTGVDDLLANCGADNVFSFVSNGAAIVVFSVRGLWL